MPKLRNEDGGYFALVTQPRQKIDEWVEALEGRGCKPRQRGDGWQALCPAHDDHNPSLSITINDVGRVLVTCFAGCTFDSILDALGLRGHINGHRVADPPPKARPKREPPNPQALPNRKTDTRYDYLDENGKLVFVVIRHDWPDKPKTFSQWIPAEEAGSWLPTAPMGQRPMYGLPDIIGTSGSVGITEGEKCCHALKDAWPNKAVTCWAGGTNAWHQTDWTPIAGRTVSLLSDGDVPGHKAMLALASHLHSQGCRVAIALPPVEWDSDVADWIERDGKAGAAKIIGDLLHDYTPPEPDPEPELLPEEPTDVVEGLKSGAMDELMSNPHYRMLGLVDTAIAVWLNNEGRVFVAGRERFTQQQTLVAIAPMVWWCGWAGIEELTKKQALIIGDSFIRAAGTMSQWDSSLAFGRGAARLPDGRIGYHLGDRLLIAGQERSIKDERSLVWLAETRIDMVEDATERQTSAMARAVMGYRWATPEDGRRFMGWMVVAMVGGALEWRPHLLLTAPATQGKTWILKNVLERLMGPLLTSLSDATPAAVSKVREHSSLPIAIDEAEPSEEWVMELLKTLRAASSDFGSRIRVSPNGGVNFQQARFCALLAGTVAPALGRADDTRLSPVNFGPPVENWPSVRTAILSTMEYADGVRSRIIRRAGEIAAEIDRLSVEMQTLEMDSREAMASAAFTVGWRFWGVDDREVHSQPESSGQTDASDVLLEILAVRHRRLTGEMSTAQMLMDTQDQHVLTDIMGIRTKDGGLYIEAKHRGLSGALSRSKWASVDLRKLLLQLDGAMMTEHPIRFGTLRKRGGVHPEGNATGIGSGDRQWK